MTLPGSSGPFFRRPAAFVLACVASTALACARRSWRAPGPSPDNSPAGDRFSDSGESAYFFAEGDVLVLETEGFTEVDRWEISQPYEPGLGTLDLSFSQSPYQARDA